MDATPAGGGAPRLVRAAFSGLRIIGRIARQPGLARDYAAVALRIGRVSGLKGILQRAVRPRPADPSKAVYADWIAAYDTLTPSDRAAIEARIAVLPDRPLISVLTPVYETPEPVLRRCIESVTAQLYPYWQLCLVDDASPSPHVAQICEAYAASDPRIRFHRRLENGHIAAASNTAIELAEGDWSALLDHDDELAPHALYMMAEAMAANPELDLVFSDEDKIDADGLRYDPWFKTGWNPELMLAQNGVVHLAAYRTALLRRIGGFRPGLDGSQDYDLSLRAAEASAPDRIAHIPFVLYHWRAIEGSTALAPDQKSYPYENARRAIEAHLQRVGTPAPVEKTAHAGIYRVRWLLPEPAPRVALIIPTRDRVELLRTAVDSILERTDYPDLELLVVDNRSETPTALAYLASLERRERVRVVHWDHPFSFAGLNNWAAKLTDAPLIGFVNNDIEAVGPEWLREMAGRALRPEVGCVGAKLLYPDLTVQHAGVVVGIGGLAGHAHLHQPRANPGYFARAACDQQFSAVTAACLVMRKSVFEEVGGFDEEAFAIAFNDVDLCLRVGRAGYRVVWTPYAELIHHESASLGQPDKGPRRRQFAAEAEALRTRWGAVIADDPFYNPNLTLKGGDFSLAFPPRAPKPWLSGGRFRP